MGSLSIKINDKVKTKLEILKENKGFQTISDTINCLLECYELELNKGNDPLKKFDKKEWILSYLKVFFTLFFVIGLFIF